ncbi:MAG: sensor histidine kinase, partial [Bradyrhizobium sp.]
MQASSERLRESERNRSLALAAGQMGSLEWDVDAGECICDAGQRRIFGIEPAGNALTIEDVRVLIRKDDFQNLETLVKTADQPTFQTEIQIVRADGEVRTCLCAGAVTPARNGSGLRVSIVMSDFTERKLAEERQSLLTREVDHRARNALAVVQAIVRLTKAGSQQAYMDAVEGRIQSLALAHTLLSESRWQGADVKRLVADELAPYRGADGARVQTDGPTAFLSPEKSQNLALVLHELATNSAKYGALSMAEGTLAVRWSIEQENLVLAWQESGGPPVRPPSSEGFGTKIMNVSIKRQSGGNVTWDWRASGLHCTLHIPLGGERLPDSAPKNLIHLSPGVNRRILLAEDDAM